MFLIMIECAKIRQLIFLEEKKDFFLHVEKSLYLCSRKKKRDVAQLASAPRSGRGGRTFESSHPDLFLGYSMIVGYLFLYGSFS